MTLLRTQKRLALYLLLLAMAGMSLVLLVTHKFGPGMSTDGARYLSTAESLIEGRGFYDYLNLPLTQFPPLYSILIAGVSLLIGMDVFPAAQILNIVTLGLVIWLAGYFFYRLFPNEILFAYIGSTVFATSLSLIIMASNVLSDLLFLAFTLAFLILATQVLETGTRRNILLMGIVAAICPFQRYAGLALIFTGALLILFLYMKNPLRGVLLAGLFGVFTGLPIFLWVFFHNYLQTGILFGVRMPPVYLGNFLVTLEKAEHWFLPATLTNIIPSWTILLIVLLVLFTGNRFADWK
ncbi:MAG: ArnT family glycosyltransferase, partial [Byssovorax cruenta]